MYQQNVKEEYAQALRMGLRESKELSARGANPYPAVLDKVLEDLSSHSIQEISLVDIPADRIVGIKSEGRVTAFSASFYPLLDPESEFAIKWTALCNAHLSDEGIREPILCYEYLGDFYVQEGNKRVSVLKYFGAAKIPGTVKRVLPREGDEARVKAYYEFLDFYNGAKIYDVQFRKPGEYAKLLAFLGKTPGEAWDQRERRTFVAYFHYFKEAFSALGGKRPDLRAEDALLLWLQVYPFRKLGEMSDKELKKSLSDLWPNVLAGADEEPVKLHTQPDQEEGKGLLSRLITPAQEHLQVAFVHQRSVAESPWTRGHEEGRLHLEAVLAGQVTTESYFHADTPEQAEAILDQAVAEGAQAVFTTTPQLLRPTLKAAVKYPKVRFLNCSADSPLSSVRSYYCRVFEGKFVTGAIAGARTKDDRIGYIGTYPILGVPASINAFALGAQMTNPNARILLEWSCMPGDPAQTLYQKGVRMISNRDIPTQDASNLGRGAYGLYVVNEDRTTVPLASPCWLWGQLYEKLVRSILSGAWKKAGTEAVNYWWGMDSGVIDVTLSDEIPESLKSLAGLLMRNMRMGTLDPFYRRILAQDGTVKNDGSHGFSPMELLRMDWLCENVEGHIPTFDELLPTSQNLVRELGIHREQIPQKKEGAL